MRRTTERTEVMYSNASGRATTWKLERGTIVKAFAEFLGTAFLLFIGCMATVGSMTINPPAESLAPFNFGLVINTVIMMLGHISGAYLNPAMTLGAMICGYRSVPTGIILIVAEIIGGIVGFGVLMSVTPSSLWHTGYPDKTTGICLTLVHSEMTTLQGLIVELICTVILMLVSCSTWDARNSHKSDSTSLRIGFAVSALSISAVPYSGCSMNPVRSLAPSLWQNNWSNHWIYWVGSCSGALLGTLIYRIIFKDSTYEYNYDKDLDETPMSAANKLVQLPDQR